MAASTRPVFMVVRLRTTRGTYYQMLTSRYWISLSLSFFLSVFASCPRGNRVSSSIVFACDRQSDYTRLRIACISKLASCSNKSRDGIPIFIECKEKIGGVEGMKKEKKKGKKFSLVGSWFISKGAEVYTGEWRRLICEQVLLSAR